MTEEIQEPFPVQEVHVDGSGDHFVIGDTLKFTLWSWQRIPGMEGVHRVAVLRVARQIASIGDSIAKTQSAVQTREFRASDGELMAEMPRH